MAAHPLTAPLLGNRHDEYRSQGAPATWRAGHALCPPHAYANPFSAQGVQGTGPPLRPESPWVGPALGQHRALPGALPAGASAVAPGVPRVLDGDLLAQFRDLNSAVQRAILGPPALWRAAGDAAKGGDLWRRSGDGKEGDVLAGEVGGTDRGGTGHEGHTHGVPSNESTPDSGVPVSGGTESPGRAAGCAGTTSGSGAGIVDTGSVADRVTAGSVEAGAAAQAAPGTPPQRAPIGGPKVRPRPSPGLSSLLDGLSPFCKRRVASHLPLRSVAWASRAGHDRAPYVEDGAGEIPLEPVLSLLEQVQNALY